MGIAGYRLLRRAPCPPSAPLGSMYIDRVCGSPAFEIQHEFHSSSPCFLCVDLLVLHDNCAGSLPLGTGHLVAGSLPLGAGHLVGLVPLVGRKLLQVRVLVGRLALDRGKEVVAAPWLVVGLLGFVAGHAPAVAPLLLAVFAGYPQYVPICDQGLRSVLAPPGLGFACAPSLSGAPLERAVAVAVAAVLAPA